MERKDNGGVVFLGLSVKNIFYEGEPVLPIDYRCVGCRFVVLVCNMRYVLRNKTTVYAGMRGWKLQLSELILCQESAGSIWSKKLTRSMTFSNMCEKSIFSKCISWLKGLYFGVNIGVFEGGSNYLINGVLTGQYFLCEHV